MNASLANYDGTFKDLIRKQYLTKRQQISKDIFELKNALLINNIYHFLKLCKNNTLNIEQEYFTESVANKLKKLKNTTGIKSVAIFYPIKNEPNLLLLIKKLSCNYHFCLPVLIKGVNEMCFKQITIDDIENHNLQTQLGIKIPVEQSPIISPDIIITPAIAFTKNKNRIGYGRGYYDKFFEKHPNTLKIGVCFDNFITSFQHNSENDIENNIFTHQDIKMDIIITNDKNF